VQALAPEETKVTPRLAALVRKQLIRPGKPQLAGEDGFRFRHLLIRDAAYEALPKAVRAELHERFAAWLVEQGSRLVELDEILGYHLEQACRYRVELGLPEDRELATAARNRLAAAGGRAYVREDYTAAVSLLERAGALVPAEEIDIVLELELVDALFWGGRAREACQRAGLVVERAAAVGDRIAGLCARIHECDVRTWLEPEGAMQELATLVADVLPVLEAEGDDFALHVAYQALGQLANSAAKADAMLEAYERAGAHGMRAGVADRLVFWRDAGRFFGTTESCPSVG
jgi:hypothetical protein